MVNLCQCSERSCRKWHPIIEEAIKEQAAATAKRNETFVLNMSELARRCGISRPTLYQHELFIEQLIRRLEIDRNRVEGHGQVQALKEQLAQRENRISDLEQQVASLHLGLAELYTALYLNGISPEHSVEDLTGRVCSDYGTCVMKQLGKSANTNNIIELDKPEKPRR